MHEELYFRFYAILKTDGSEEQSYGLIDDPDYRTFYNDYRENSLEYLKVCPNRTILRIAEFYDVDHFFDFFRDEIDYIDSLPYSSVVAFTIVGFYHDLLHERSELSKDSSTRKPKDDPFEFSEDDPFGQLEEAPLVYTYLYIRSYYENRGETYAKVEHIATYPTGVTRNLDNEEDILANSQEFVHELEDMITNDRLPFLKVKDENHQRALFYLDGLLYLYYPAYYDILDLDLLTLASVIVALIEKIFYDHDEPYAKLKKSVPDIGRYLEFYEKYNYLGEYDPCWDRE